MVLHMLFDILISYFLIKKNIMKVSGIKNDISFDSKKIWASRFNIELWAKLLVLKHMVLSAQTSKLCFERNEKKLLDLHQKKYLIEATFKIHFFCTWCSICKDLDNIQIVLAVSRVSKSPTPTEKSGISPILENLFSKGWRKNFKCCLRRMVNVSFYLRIIEYGD